MDDTLNTLLEPFLRTHGGTNPGAAKGNKNALKHGFYTAEAIAERRNIRELIRASRCLACEL